MDYKTFRDTLREWFVTQMNLSLPAIEIQKPNESKTFGVDVTYVRLTIQTAETGLSGSGTEIGAHNRTGRVFAEIFGPEALGDGAVSDIATKVEFFFRRAMKSAMSPHKDIYLNEPSTFERAEKNRYCQVVSVPVRVMLFT